MRGRLRVTFSRLRTVLDFYGRYTDQWKSSKHDSNSETNNTGRPRAVNPTFLALARRRQCGTSARIRQLIGPESFCGAACVGAGRPPRDISTVRNVLPAPSPAGINNANNYGVSWASMRTVARMRCIIRVFRELSAGIIALRGAIAETIPLIDRLAPDSRLVKMIKENPV